MMEGVSLEEREWWRWEVWRKYNGCEPGEIELWRV